MGPPLPKTARLGIAGMDIESLRPLLFGIRTGHRLLRPRTGLRNGLRQERYHTIGDEAVSAD